MQYQNEHITKMYKYKTKNIYLCSTLNHPQGALHLGNIGDPPCSPTWTDPHSKISHLEKVSEITQSQGRGREASPGVGVGAPVGWAQQGGVLVDVRLGLEGIGGSCPREVNEALLEPRGS